MTSEERPELASEEHVVEAEELAVEVEQTARALATEHRLEQKVLASEATLVVDRLHAVEEALRSRTRIIIVVGSLIALIGFYMVVSQVQGNAQRALILHAVQEIKDCTTPTEDNACQKRLAAGQRPVLLSQSEDNLRASIAVGSCLREQAPNVEACSLARFRAAVEKAARERAEPGP